MTAPPAKSQAWTRPAELRRARPRARAGFSLLELLVAAVVLAVGLVIVTESLSSGLTASAGVDRRLFAGQLAADRLSRAAAGEYPSFPQEGQSRQGGVEYHWELREGQRQGVLRSVLCSVAWVSRGRREMLTLSRELPPEPEGPRR